MRKNIWAGVHIDGEPLQYTGTGSELFKGFLIVAFLIFLPLGLFYFGLGMALGTTHPITLLSPLLLAPLFFFLIGVAIYLATRYRLSRTLWRGVRGTLNGSAVTYSFKNISYTLLTIITLGLYSPTASVKLTDYIGNTAEFGNEPTRFTASTDGLFSRFFLFWASAVAIVIGYIAIGMEMARITMTPGLNEFQQQMLIQQYMANNWHQYAILALMFLLGAALFFRYQTMLIRVLISGFGYQNVRFSAPTVRTGGFFWLMFTNYLIVVFSLGLFIPVAVRRTAAYLVNRIECEGRINPEGIMQNQRALDQSGEGLASAFEVDAF